MSQSQIISNGFFIMKKRKWFTDCWFISLPIFSTIYTILNLTLRNFCSCHERSELYNAQNCKETISILYHFHTFHWNNLEFQHFQSVNLFFCMSDVSEIVEVESVTSIRQLLDVGGQQRRIAIVKKSGLSHFNFKISFLFLIWDNYKLTWLLLLKTF